MEAHKASLGNDDLKSFWSRDANNCVSTLLSSTDGLTSSEASKRLQLYGANMQAKKNQNGFFMLFIAQFKSPIILILLFATALSLFLHNNVDAIIILTIVVISGLLGFWQEYSASNAVAKLLAIVQIKARVLRDKKDQDIPV